MSLLSRSLITKRAPVPQNNVSTIDGGMQMINGRLVPYQDTRNNYIVKGYNINDVIYSLNKLIVDKSKVPPWGIYRIEDEQAYKQLQLLRSNKNLTSQQYVKSLSLQSKALTPVKNAGKWGELIKYPNEQQSFTDFIGDGIAYKLLTGNKFIWANLLQAGVNQGTPHELWLLPSQWTEIFATDTFPTRVTGYNISLWPEGKYTPDQVLHEKYFNPNWNINGEQLYGMAPLKAALLRLKKNNSLTQAEASTFQNEGIKGLMFMKNQVGNVDGELVLPEVQRLKETLMTEWSGENNRGRIGLSGYEMGYIPIGMTSEEMQMIESSLLDLRYFCNIYGVPSQLMNDPANKTYNSLVEAEKALTTRCALPELNSTRDNLNRKGSTSWGLPAGQVFDFDMSAYSELQENVKETAEWTSQMIAISPNEQRELCGLAALPDPEMSEPWVNAVGRQPLTDFKLNAVDNALNDDTETDNDDEA